MAGDLARQLDDGRRQLTELRRAMASGVLTVEGADTGRVTYRTYDEMRRAESDLARRLSDLEVRANGGAVPRRTRQVVMTGGSGW